MITLKLTKRLLLWGGSLVYCTLAMGSSLTLQGQIRTELPKVKITHTDEPIAGAKEFVLSVNGSGGVCSISSDVRQSKNHGSTPVCKIEWEDPQGLASYLNGLKGVINVTGSHAFTYRLSMFDMDSFEPIYSAPYEVVFEAPVPPDSAILESNWKLRETNNALAHEVYTRNEEHNTLVGNVTERNYDQVIHFGDLSCTIPAGQTKCSVSVNQRFMDKDERGTIIVPFAVTDPYEFIPRDESTFTYDYDFRAPDILDVHVNANADMLPMVLDEYGESPLVLLHNQAAVIVESPHETDDPLFRPTDPTLRISQDKTLYVTNRVDYGGTQVRFDLGDFISQEQIDVTPINDPLQVGNYYIYVYDFSHIQDGLYDFEFSTLDGNGNGTERSVNDVYVDRYPPDIQFVVNGKQFTSSSRANLYALSDLTVLTWGGWADGAKITGATLNDEPINFASGTNNVKRLETVPLISNSINTLAVTATDAIGNETKKTFEFKFANYVFQQQPVSVLEDVEPAKIEIRQIAGPYCVLQPDDVTATLFSEQNVTSYSRGCTINWLDHPPEIDVSSPSTVSRSNSVVGQGTLTDPGNYTYRFEVMSHDPFGNALKVYEGEGTIEVHALEEPELIVGLPHIFNNYPSSYRYTQTEDYNLNVRATVNAVPNAEVVIELRDPGNQVIEAREFTSSTGRIRTGFRKDNDLTPLQPFDYSVRAYYKTRPERYVEHPYNLFTTPGRAVRLFLEHEATLNQGEVLNIVAQMGKSQGQTVEYSPSMGTWSVGLYVFDKDTQGPKLIQEAVETNLSGIANLALSADQLLLNENRVFAMATLKAPYPEIDVTRRANSLYNVPVLSVGGISAQLVSNTMSAPVPARFVAKVDYESILDKNTAGKIDWQTSSDGETWTQVASKHGLTNYLFALEEPGEIFVRAVVSNRLNDDKYFTNTLQFIGYREALIELLGDRTVVEGAVGQYHASLNDYAYSHLSGAIEWSTDNQVTWQTMADTELLEITTSTDLHVRALVDTPDDEPHYIYDELQVTTLSPRKLNSLLRASTNRAEAGDEIDITASFARNSLYKEADYKYELILPDGTRQEALTLTHQLLPSDFVNGDAEFKFRSWVDGMELATVSTRSVKVKELIYDGLPETGLDLQTPERVNYSFVNLRLKKPFPSQLPPSVVIDQEVLLPTDDSLELKHVFGSSLRLVAKKEGVHPITVRYFDNRGNEREHTEFVTILAPPPPKVTLKNALFGDYLRPPLRMNSSLTYKFGSPNDRLDYVDWTVNGESIDISQRSIRQHVLTEPGTYEIGAKVVSQFGQEKVVSETFELEANKEPVCEPYWEQRDRVSTLHANCKDFDGRVVRVAFTYAYEEDLMRTVNRYFNPSMAFVETLYDPSVPIEMTVVDDSDATVDMEITWP